MASFNFSMSVEVDDPQELRAIALQHPDVTDETFLNIDGEVDIPACLVMLLDPGTLPGCSISSSGAEMDNEDLLIDFELEEAVSKLEARKFQ